MCSDLANSLKTWSAVLNYLVLSPVSVDSGRNKIGIKKTRKYIAYCGIFMLLNGAQLFNRFHVNTENFNLINFAVYNFIWLLIAANYILRTFTGYGKSRNIIIEILNNIIDINRELCLLGTLITYKRLLSIVYCEIAVMIIIQLYLHFITYLFFGKIVLHFFISPAMFYIFEILHFYNYVWVVHNSFKQINRHLICLNPRETDESELFDEIAAVKMCHEKMIRSTILLNGIFEMLNLLYIINTFTEASQIIYFLMKSILNYELVYVKIPLIYRFTFCVWPMTLLISLALVISICTRVDEESKRTGILALDLRRKCRNRKIQDKVVYLRQLIQKLSQFSIF